MLNVAYHVTLDFPREVCYLRWDLSLVSSAFHADQSKLIPADGG